MLTSSLEDVVVRLEAIIDWAQYHQSRLGYFAALYRKMTIRVQEAVAAGRFDDNDRMIQIGVIFANRYIEAFDAYRLEHMPTQVWRLAFEAAQTWRPLVVQHLLLGMNAHINLDLGIAVARSVTPDVLPHVRDDFDKINDILANLIDQVQAELTEIWPLHGLLDWIGGRHDEVIINFSLTKARAQAWRIATRLAPLTEAEQDREIVALDQLTTALGRFIRHPGMITSAFLSVIRLGERGTTSEIIEILK